MFEELLKKLKELENGKVSIPVDNDKRGYVDKECPSKECLFQFKVHADDWKNLFKDEAIFCPKCRHEANSNSWWTTEQLENARTQGMKYIKGVIGDAMQKDARNFNRRQPSDSFIKMSMKVGGSSQQYYLMPIPATEAMQLDIQCERCNARFAVIGSAFFCPCCGHNSVERMFEEAIKKIEIKLNNIELVKKAFNEMGKKDEGEITSLSLVETGLQDCISAFQRYSEEVFKRFTQEEPGFNTFQKLDVGSALWKKKIGEGYEEWLDKKELLNLNILFQKRHLLAHKEGIVDDKYITKSFDKTYKAGQRIVIKERDVREVVNMVRKIVERIEMKVN